MLFEQRRFVDSTGNVVSYEVYTRNNATEYFLYTTPGCYDSITICELLEFLADKNIFILNENTNFLGRLEPTE